MSRLRRILLTVASHRTLALIRWDLHFLRVRAQNALTGAGRRLGRRTEGVARPLYLNLGSGERGIDEANWVNVDGFAHPNTHYLTDISRPLPFSDGSFDGIFFQHVLEHFPRETGVTILRECRRILAPLGLLRVAVPDAERVARTYVNHPAELLAHRTAPTGIPMEVVNLYAYQRYEHQCLYDFDLLRYTLTEAGFIDVTRRTLRESADPALAVDDPGYAWESLYAEARAPVGQ